ncbi:MAG: hypothetical protein ACLSH8_16540 [Zhenhengia sp.]|uniref:hypothetical protein n=1 Tax=Zhenhengia sp. TaxID=2944208 RepID=UPI003992DBCB
MKTYKVIASQNGWEYVGNYIIKCNEKVEQIDKYILKIDDNAIIIFDDEVSIEE